MEETYREVFYDTKRNIYIVIEIDYSKIEGQIIEEKINTVKSRCKLLPLIYCERGKTEDRFVLPMGCVALLPRHTLIVKFDVDNDFYNFINYKRKKLIVEVFNDNSDDDNDNDNVDEDYIFKQYKKRIIHNLWGNVDEEEKENKDHIIKVPSADTKISLKEEKGFLSRTDKKKLKKNKNKLI